MLKDKYIDEIDIKELADLMIENNNISIPNLITLRDLAQMGIDILH